MVYYHQPRYPHGALLLQMPFLKLSKHSYTVLQQPVAITTESGAWPSTVGDVKYLASWEKPGGRESSSLPFSMLQQSLINSECSPPSPNKLSCLPGWRNSRDTHRGTFLDRYKYLNKKATRGVCWGLSDSQLHNVQEMHTIQTRFQIRFEEYTLEMKMHVQCTSFQTSFNPVFSLLC